MSLGSLIPWRDKEQAPARSEDFYDPFGSFRRHVDRMFDDLLTGSLARFPGFDRLSAFGPSVDVEDTDKELVVTAELPGLDDKDFEVTITGDVLTIQGEKKVENENHNGGAHYVERRYGAFPRSLRLPFEASNEKVEATYDKGILTVRVPKPLEAQRPVRRVEVKASSA